MTRRVHVGRLTIRLPAGTRLVPGRLAREIGRAIAATAPGADLGRLSVAVDAPRPGEAGTAATRRIGRQVSATARARGGGDAG